MTVPEAGMDVAPVFFFDRGELVARGEALADRYRTNQPFPHVHLDDFFPPGVLRRVIDEFPSPGAEAFEQPDNDYQVNKLGRVQDNDFAGVSPFIRNLLAELNSRAMLDFLEALTGIEGLIPDPHFEGAALHQILPGGKLAVHADFNRDLRRDLERRVNVLIYLNEDWDEDWGGHLELWNRDMTACVSRIAPLANRCVVFSTSSTSFHGHPDPLTCPKGVTRRSIALYYYSRGRDDGPVDFHGTLWQARPGHDDPASGDQVAHPAPVEDAAPAAPRSGAGWKAGLKRWLPPAVVDGLRRLRRA